MATSTVTRRTPVASNIAMGEQPSSCFSVGPVVLPTLRPLVVGYMGESAADHSGRALARVGGYDCGRAVYARRSWAETESRDAVVLSCALTPGHYAE